MRWVKNGVRVGEAGYTVSALDPGFLSGMNVFETMRTYAGRVFRLDRHLSRLEGSARALGVRWPGTEVLAGEITAAIEGLPIELGVRLAMTVGGDRFIQVTPLDLGLVMKPLRVATRVWEPPAWLDGRVKHGSRAFSEVARLSAGVDEVFWIGHDGTLTEATRSSIFAVLHGTLVTPPDDGRILSGVTRSALLEAAATAGVVAHEAPLRLDLPLAELYASSTLKELSPIVELDGAPAPGAGPVGARVVEAFRALVAKECGA